MKRKGLVQSLVLCGILTAGFAAVWGIAAVWIVEVGTYTVASISTGNIMIPLRAWLTFLRDGTPLVTYQNAGHRRQLRDLQGNPVAEPESEFPPFLLLAALPAKSNVSEGHDWAQRIRPLSDGQDPEGYWYFIVEGRRGGTGYFVGYDSDSRTCLGYLGTSGLRERPLPIEERIPFEGVFSGRFDGRLLCNQPGSGWSRHPRNGRLNRAPKGSVSGWDVYVQGADGKLYHADLRKRAIKVSFGATPVLSAALSAGVPNAIHGTPYRPAVRTKDAVQVLDENGAVQKRYPIPELLRGQDITFGETDGGEAVMYANSPDDILASEVDYRIFRVDAAGHCRQATTTLPYLGLKRLVMAAGVVMPSPLPLAGTVAALRPSSLLENSLAATYPEALGRALREFLPAFAVAQTIALALAMLCYRRQVRYGASRNERIVWTVFVLLFGLPGWIGYRFGRSWPVLEACPDCGAVVPRDRECCLHCTNDFPRPALRGTEVFA